MNAPATPNLPARLPIPQAALSIGVDRGQWAVLTDAIFPSARTPEAIVLAVNYCRARGLDVFKRPVHIVPVWNSQLRREVETVWPGINETQVTAARTGQWAGMDAPRWGPDQDGYFCGVDPRSKEKMDATVIYPEWCELTVYRLVGGMRCAFTETVYWLEAYAGQKGTAVPNAMWQKRPHGQLHKCAKAASLRAAFPEAGDYTAEEMEGKTVAAGGVVVDGRAETVEPERQEFDPAYGFKTPEPHDPTAGEIGHPEPPPATPKRSSIPILDAGGAEIGAATSYGDWLGEFRRRWEAERSSLTHHSNAMILAKVIAKMPEGFWRDEAEKLAADLAEDIEALQAGAP